MNEWLKVAKERSATHLIIMYDKDEKDYYPVYIMPTDNLKSICSKLTLSEGHQSIKKVIPCQITITK